MDGNSRKKAQMRLTFLSLPSFFRTALCDRSPFSISIPGANWMSAAAHRNNGSDSEGERDKWRLFSGSSSPLSISPSSYLSCCLSIGRPGYLQKAHSSHWKYRPGRRFGHPISLFHSPSPPHSLSKPSLHKWQVLTDDDATRNRFSPSDFRFIYLSSTR